MEVGDHAHWGLPLTVAGDSSCMLLRAGVSPVCRHGDSRKAEARPKRVTFGKTGKRQMEGKGETGTGTERPAVFSSHQKSLRGPFLRASVPIREVKSVPPGAVGPMSPRNTEGVLHVGVRKGLGTPGRNTDTDHLPFLFPTLYYISNI